MTEKGSAPVIASALATVDRFRKQRADREDGDQRAHISLCSADGLRLPLVVIMASTKARCRPRSPGR